MTNDPMPKAETAALLRAWCVEFTRRSSFVICRLRVAVALLTLPALIAVSCPVQAEPPASCACCKDCPCCVTGDTLPQSPAPPPPLARMAVGKCFPISSSPLVFLSAAGTEFRPAAAPAFDFPPASAPLYRRHCALLI
jgi:hypothetical protein